MKIPAVSTILSTSGTRSAHGSAHLRSKKKKTISANGLVEQLLALPEIHKERMVTLFLETLSHLHASEYQKPAKRCFEKFLDKASGQEPFSRSVQKLIAQVADTYFPKRGQFPKATRLLSEFEQIATDAERIRKEHKAILKRENSDPAMCLMRDAQKGKDKKFTFGMHYPVQLADGTKMILLSAPKASDVATYYREAIHKNVAVMVTLCSSYETPRIAKFWHKETACNTSLENGWKIEEVRSTLLYEGNLEQKRPPRIIEREIDVSNDTESRTFTHLQYENWGDHEIAPSHDGLRVLSRRIDEVSQGTQSPVMINCRGSRGRTGTVALIHAARAKIHAQLSSGVLLDEIRLNLSEIVYEIKKTRPRVGSNPDQLKQAYEAIGLYYKELKEGL